MHEIECILHEYLSFNWDRVEDIYDANSVYLSEDGLRCLWRSSHHLSVGAGLSLCHENLFAGYSTVPSLLGLSQTCASWLVHLGLTAFCG